MTTPQFYTLKERPPKEGEILLHAHSDGFMVGWEIGEVETVEWLRSIKKTDIKDGGTRSTTHTTSSKVPLRGYKLKVRLTGSQLNGEGYFLLTKECMEVAHGHKLIA